MRHHSRRVYSVPAEIGTLVFRVGSTLHQLFVIQKMTERVTNYQATPEGLGNGKWSLN